MTAPSSLLDLDDVDALLAADVDGTLRFAALGGAQIRATAAAVHENALARLHGMQPRSVVLVSGEGSASRAAELTQAAVGSRIGVPVLGAVGTPPWVGPLDVVVVAGDDAGDPRLVESVDSALRRGAEVVVVAPDEGPMRAAGAGRALLLPPRVAVQVSTDCSGTSQRSWRSSSPSTRADGEDRPGSAVSPTWSTRRRCAITRRTRSSTIRESRWPRGCRADVSCSPGIPGRPRSWRGTAARRCCASERTWPPRRTCPMR